MKAKLEQAKEAEMQSQRSDRNSQLKSYVGRFRRPGESQDSGMNSHRNLTAEHRATAHGSSASWRKKDSRFIRTDSSEMCDKDERSDKARGQEASTAHVELQQVSSSGAARPEIQTRKAQASCKY